MKISVVCHGIAERRIEFGWDQATLARKSGYSVRVISKAENGNPIARSTAEDIADALEVSVEKFLFDPIEVAKEFVDGMHCSPKEFLRILPNFLHPEIIFNIPGPEEIPFSGTHHGIDEVVRCFTIFFDVLESPKHDHMDCYTFTGTRDMAIVHGESWIHPKGRPLVEPIHLILKFEFRNGRIIRLDDIFDTDKGNKVINPREPN